MAKALGGDASRLVNQICTPGGLRAQPSREDLRIFVESLGSQSGQQIAELLEDKLASLLEFSDDVDSHCEAGPLLQGGTDLQRIFLWQRAQSMQPCRAIVVLCCTSLSMPAPEVCDMTGNVSSVNMASMCQASRRESYASLNPRAGIFCFERIAHEEFQCICSQMLLGKLCCELCVLWKLSSSTAAVSPAERWPSTSR